MLRLILADDHTLVRQGLLPFLATLDTAVEVLEASDFDEALSKATAEKAKDAPLSLILLDLRMPGMRGTSGISRMIEEQPGVPVVILSGSIDAGDVVACAEAGANGYLPKTLSSTAMLNALRLVLSGEKYFPSFAVGATARPATEMDREPANSPPSGPSPLLERLEPRERIILGMVVDGATNKEIARALDLQEVTIKVQTRNIYRKLGAANRSQAVRIAMENGWQT